jgi:hypothetical protein
MSEEDDNEIVEIYFLDIVAETEKAYLLHLGENRQDVWVPKSRIEMYEDQDLVEMPFWLAKDKDLI